MKHSAFCITCHRPEQATKPPKIPKERKARADRGLPRGRPRVTKVDVPEAIRMHLTGSTLKEIGDLYGVTRERVQQLLSPHGLGFATSGRHAQVVQRASERRAAVEARHEEVVQRRRGMPAADYDAVRKLETADGATASSAFMNQRRTQQLNYGREWKLTFAEWWKLWDESGHWLDRGRGRDKYVLALIDRTGAFEAGNVKVAQFGPLVSQQRREERDAGTGMFARRKSKTPLVTAGNRE